MQYESLREYLTLIGEALSESLTEWSVETFDDGLPALLFTAPAPFDANAQLGYCVSVTPYAEKMILFEIEITVFSSVPEELTDSLNAVITALNNIFVIGGFVLSSETAEVIFRNGMFLSAETQINAVTENIIRTLSVMESAAADGAVQLLRLINNEATADELTNELYAAGGDVQ